VKEVAYSLSFSVLVVPLAKTFLLVMMMIFGVMMMIFGVMMTIGVMMIFGVMMTMMMLQHQLLRYLLVNSAWLVTVSVARPTL
jgi:hypothetical protein